ncbi:hypothetical protein [Laceyella putida]|uniref:Uncharacterized protein n=1 Tax=Laceyella putida TaxID=110101 RepID=A0ABW2RQQ4_9BACL
MSWMDVKGPKGNWMQAKQQEHLPGGYDWYDPKSQPVKTLIDQKEVTLSSFFTKIGKFFLSLK